MPSWETALQSEVIGQFWLVLNEKTSLKAIGHIQFERKKVNKQHNFQFLVSDFKISQMQC